jgi:NhaA family Na+:H+ antiporter
MSLFIAMLAFDDAASVNAAKRGIIAGSLLAGVAGAMILRTGRPLRDAK